MGTADSRNNNSGKGILNKLKAMERMIRKAIEKRVTVVKLRRNKRIGKDDSRITIKTRTDLAKSADMVERRRADRRNVFFERKIIVESDTQVATGRNMKKRSTLEGDCNSDVSLKRC